MKKAYTLSEVLVVLLVLGIIAAFIIPAVMRTAPDRAALLYKKSFYSLQEAAEKIINNPTLYPQNPEGTDANGNTIPARKGYFTDPPALAGYEGKPRIYLCENLAKTLNTVGRIDCSSEGSDGSPNFTTSNGVRWWNIASNDPFSYGNDSNDENPNQNNVQQREGDMFIDISLQCNGTTYHARIFQDGRVGTGPTGGRLNIANSNINNQISGDAYKEENNILQNPFKFRDL